LVEGTEVLRKVLREPLPADPQPALLKALDRAQRSLDAARPRIAGLTIKVAAVDQLSVKIDGNPLAVALLETEIPSDPGEHSIEATAPGFLKASTRIVVSDAEKKTVTLTLTRDPNAAVSASRAPASEAAPPQPTTTGPQPVGTSQPSQAAPAPAPPPAPNRTGAYLALGAGVVGVGVGSVLGVMTMKQRQDLKGTCPSDVCLPGQQGALDSAKRLGTFSTVAFGVGGAGLVLGTVLFFTAGPSSSDRAAAPARHRAVLTGLRADVGPGGVALSGKF
jgi:hypothetical protein